jgi:uncharacterized protein (TIGR03083 family)
MDDVRATFLAAARVAAVVLGLDEVADAWDGPSALPEFTVRGLAGHLVRAVGSADAYLDRDEPSDERVIDAARYYRLAVGDATEADLGSDLHRSIRQRGEDMAAAGWEALAADFEALLDRMSERLASERADRRVEVYQGLVLPLDEYLVTRLIELVVHIDDLCVSVGVPTPPMPDGAMDAAVGALVGVARVRHGDLLVLRALTRRERADATSVLRIL